MSAAVPVNWAGCKVNNETDLVIIDNKKTRSTPVPFTFPNGRPCPENTQIDRYGRYVVPGFSPSGAVNMNADGEVFGQLSMPVSYVQSCLNNEQGQTVQQRNATLIEYILFIRDYVPGSPEDVIATAWAARAAAVNNNGWSGAGITIAHVQADATQINQPRYNTSMDQF